MPFSAPLPGLADIFARGQQEERLRQAQAIEQQRQQAVIQQQQFENAAAIRKEQAAIEAEQRKRQAISDLTNGMDPSKKRLFAARIAAGDTVNAFKGLNMDPTTAKEMVDTLNGIAGFAGAGKTDEETISALETLMPHLTPELQQAAKDPKFRATIRSIYQDKHPTPKSTQQTETLMIDGVPTRVSVLYGPNGEILSKRILGPAQPRGQTYGEALAEAGQAAEGKAARDKANTLYNKTE